MPSGKRKRAPRAQAQMAATGKRKHTPRAQAQMAATDEGREQLERELSMGDEGSDSEEERGVDDMSSDTEESDQEVEETDTNKCDPRLEQALRATLAGRRDLKEYHYTALIAAARIIRGPDRPLTAESSPRDTGEALKATGQELEKMLKGRKKKQKIVAFLGELAFPPPDLIEGVVKHLKAEAAQASGGRVAKAREAVLLERRKDICMFLLKRKIAPGACVKQKHFFARIREQYPDVSPRALTTATAPPPPPPPPPQPLAGVGGELWD